MTDDDAEITAWALAAGRGDQDSATRFIRATQQYIWRFVAHLISPSEADDLTQETYLRAMRSLPSFAARSSARTWLLGIARKVAVDHVRAATRRPRTTQLSDRHDVPDAGGSAFDGAVVLNDLLCSLAPDRREAFVATQILGLSYAETAEVCGCPVGTIRSRVARAREDLVAAVDASSWPARRQRGSAAS
ncbi:sigma-70 family RNA polymerase sigma factor [Micromonospora sp. HM134]|uniref:sigma-70 family RNA polymerase sigma factor n=1 Tax=Micromonospora sp. HM134 TaxID=2583243 RepID=UPI0011988FF8|nr:sigma-70 family RNA polymerase sigma factor [Micromonospora sp. HM134]QDY09500.1 sigma-70 family RNA polymerase sigma factor [Micromonospora sp. HM134]